jgi:hypothetical protein
MAQTPRHKAIGRAIETGVEARTALRQLIAAAAGVRARRRMNAPEDPETQDAWDRLRVAVLEAERALQKSVDKRVK